MTICVAVKVSEGLVLAADSAASLAFIQTLPDGQTRQVEQTFEHANKVTQVAELPIGVLNWGLASIENRTIHSLILEYERTLDAGRAYSVREVADGLLSFIQPRYVASFPSGTPQQTLGMLVGGYSPGAPFPDHYSIELPLQSAWVPVRPDQPNGSPQFGVNWYGMTDALTRLILGYDMAGISDLLSRGADLAILQQWINAGGTPLLLFVNAMSLQDAVDFAHYLIQVVIGRFRFAAGPRLCGGDVDVAVISAGGGFQWAQRKPWAIKG